MSFQDFFRQEHELRDKYGSQVFANLKRLVRITRTIEIVAMTVFILLISQMVILIASLLSLRRILYLHDTDLILMASFIFFITILALFVHERLKRNGDIIFNEVSDELQWSLESRRFPKSPNDFHSEKEQRPNITIRIILRTFIRNTDLPLAASRLGPLIYLAMSFLIWSSQLVASIIARGPNSLS
jgi:hypothetical protein